MIYVVAFWILCGIASAAALSRYNKAGIGCLLGTLLGPIGIIIALIMRSDARQNQEEASHAAPAREQEQRGSEHECPYCAELILSRATVCKHCGRDVQPVG